MAATEGQDKADILVLWCTDHAKAIDRLIVDYEHRWGIMPNRLIVPMLERSAWERIHVFMGLRILVGNVERMAVAYDPLVDQVAWWKKSWEKMASDPLLAEEEEPEFREKQVGGKE